MKKTLYLLIGLVIIAGIWFTVQNKNDTPSTENNKTTNPSPNPSNPPAAVPADGDAWTGTLLASDSSVKGNLMLVNGTEKIYIRTSRDFSSLIGKEVAVSFEGSKAGFTLLDIKLK